MCTLRSSGILKYYLPLLPKSYIPLGGELSLKSGNTFICSEKVIGGGGGSHSHSCCFATPIKQAEKNKFSTSERHFDFFPQVLQKQKTMMQLFF